MDEKVTKASRNGLLEFLMEFVTPERQQRFREVIRQRTRHLTVVLENVFQPHNASAVLRTAECYGIQDIHVIEDRNAYKVNPDIALGAKNWITIHRHPGHGPESLNWLRELKKQGYALVATSPHKDTYTPENLPLQQKTALLFGTELEGLTQHLLDEADLFLRIPMVGFTESLNVSVSAGICLHTLTTRLRSSDIQWELTQEEQTEIMIQWAKVNLKNPEILEQQYYGGRRRK